MIDGITDDACSTNLKLFKSIWLQLGVIINFGKRQA